MQSKGKVKHSEKVSMREFLFDYNLNPLFMFIVITDADNPGYSSGNSAPPWALRVQTPARLYIEVL